MSLYYDAAPLLAASQSGSLKSRVFGAKNLKSPPKQVFALVTETTKWSEVLSEVIERSALLQHEHKLSPSLALLLVHDLLVSKKGVSAPSSHPLRLAVERHRARLGAEFTKARLRRGCSSVEALRAKLDHGGTALIEIDEREAHVIDNNASKVQAPAQPRWFRINTLLTTVDEQLATTFAGYKAIKSLKDLTTNKAGSKLLYIDENIPNLLAVSAGVNLSSMAAYREGQIILQDKASCFPAYLIGPPVDGRTCLDACAAPGNKTTHMAAIVQSGHPTSLHSTKIIACERDKSRAETLKKMVSLAGGNNLVDIRSGQDFLKVDPTRPPFSKVGSILLDPSCSGSGIVGRDDTPSITLPSRDNDEGAVPPKSRKRKRPAKGASVADFTGEVVDTDAADQQSNDLDARLDALSGFQLRLLLHAFRFPNASRLVYSTCSIHARENEHVVVQGLLSTEAKARGWRIMRLDEQPDGLRPWPIRGDISTCSARFPDAEAHFVEEVRQACIRCVKGTEQGTQGFFVAGFVRSEEGSNILNGPTTVAGSGVEHTSAPSLDSESEWEGFEDPDIG